MIQSQRSLTALPLHPLMIQRRRPLRVAPPARAVAMLAMPALAAIDEIGGDARDWKDELSFFLACYAAGLLFFLVMLS
jgi:hypothetical protein